MAKAVSKKKTPVVAITAGVYPVLSPDKTTCTIGDRTLVLNSDVDYKSSTEELSSFGRIMEFKYAGYQQSDTTSVWMNVGDLMSKEVKTEWISVSVWYDQTILRESKTLENDNHTQQAPVGDLPF